MSNVFSVVNTAGTLSITLKPGTFNGPGGSRHDTDLRLYGLGAQAWGEGVDTNVLRLAENFACPAKELNDYNPATGNYDYDPSTDPVMPKDDHDLGVGKGISRPIQGQTWFNTTSGKLYVYTKNPGSPVTFSWVSTGGVDTSSPTQPTTPNNGDMWFDPSDEQLKIYMDGAWKSVADNYLPLDGTVNMTGNLDMTDPGTGSYRVINLHDPINPQDAATKNYVDNEILTITTGGALDGTYLRTDGTNLMDTAAVLQFGTGGHLILNQGAGNASAAPDIFASNVFLMASSQSTILMVDSDNSAAGDFIVSKGSTALDGNQTDLFRVYNNGTLRAMTPNYENLVLSNNDIPNKKYVDNAINGLTAGGAGGIPVINPSTPKDGDIKIDPGPVIYIYGQGAWNKIFPAVYSA